MRTASISASTRRTRQSCRALFEVHSLTLKGTAPGLPLKYQAVLTNPKPPGKIQVAGDFGPWQKDDSGETPISGQYTFSNADLSVFKSIAGILDSTGQFDGVLRRIAVHGETRTPQFHLAGGNAVPLTTRFESIVDGTTGDTFLEPVRATLGNSTMEARGRIVQAGGGEGAQRCARRGAPEGTDRGPGAARRQGAEAIPDGRDRAADEAADSTRARAARLTRGCCSTAGLRWSDRCLRAGLCRTKSIC